MRRTNTYFLSMVFPFFRLLLGHSTNSTKRAIGLGRVKEIRCWPQNTRRGVAAAGGCATQVGRVEVILPEDDR